MQIAPLLNANLKGQSLVELLELWDCDVVYDYDRLHENTPDAYWAALHELGVHFKFDERQVVSTIFLYVRGDDNFSPFDLSSSDIEQFESIAAVETFAQHNKLRSNTGTAEFLGETRDWIKLNLDGYSTHYEFRGGTLSLVTLSVEKPK